MKNMPPSLKNNSNPVSPAAAGHREGERVRVPECDLAGIITAVFNLEPSTRNPSPPYYRVHFPITSPFVENWAVYRAHEVTRAPAKANDMQPSAYKENYPPANHNPS